jgi:hypothetical protein
MISTVLAVAVRAIDEYLRSRDDAYEGEVRSRIVTVRDQMDALRAELVPSEQSPRRDRVGDLLQMRADHIALEREHSAVDGETRRKISTILDEELERSGTNVADDDDLIDRLMNELSHNELRGIVVDWTRIAVAL